MFSFIINPNSRSGLGLKTWKMLKQILDAEAVSYQEYFTHYPGQGTEIARELTNSSMTSGNTTSNSETASDTNSTEHTIVVLGGDGTINEVVNGIQDLSKVTFAYIPIGSGNDFARSMGVPKDPVEALKRILNPTEFVDINIGALTYENGTRRYAVSSGIGFDADVCVHNNGTSMIKRFLNVIGLGKLSYTVTALKLLLTARHGNATITLYSNPNCIDDTDFSGKQDSNIISTPDIAQPKSLYFKNIYFIAAMNQRFEGGGFKFCPDADPTDDFINIIVVSGLPRLVVPLLLPTAYKGWHVHFPGIHTYTCKSAKISSDIALPVHTDGEADIISKNVTFSLEPQSLRFIKQ